MDSRDSSSAAASDAGRDGSVLVDDAVPSVTSVLAKDAVLYFQSGKFAECIDVLNQLKQMKENDPKVLHNIAIAEYFRDGCSNPKNLLEALNSVERRSEVLARASGEQVDVPNSGNKTAVPKDSGTAGQSSITVCNNEFDNTVTILNIAVTWFHLHEYAKALSILEPLFQNIEPLDETIGLQICFLLLDVVVACRDAAKFAVVLNYMEKTYGVGCWSQGENGNTIQISTNQVSKTSSLPTSSLASDTVSSDIAAVGSSLSRSLSEETLEYDNVLAEIGAQNLTNPVEHFPANNLVKAIGDRSISTVDLKLELQLYKVRFLLLTRNLKLAKREVKHAMNIARGRDSSVALVLKSQLEYARGNHRKAIKLLMASGIHTERGTSSMFYNNLGCIYYQLGKYHTSSVLFSKALSVCSSLLKDKPTKLFSLPHDKSLLVTYNCGLLYLARGKPLLAARCFQKASLVFYRQPLLWLRIAECCLMALQKGLLEEGNTSADRSEIRVQVIGKGKWRQLLMEENGYVEVTSTNQWPKLSLPLARLCLSNALYLLNKSGLNDSKSDLQVASSLAIDKSTEKSSSDLTSTDADTRESKGGNSQDMIQNSLSFYKDIQARENQMIRQALLANMAFVEMEMENPVKALSAAKSLLELPDCSKIYVFLGHIYTAEALCLLDRTKEAGEHLSVYLHEQDGFELPFLQEDLSHWLIHRNPEFEDPKESSSMGEGQDSVFLKPKDARGMLYANLAALLATQGDFDRARDLVTQALSLLPNNVQATLTGIYIDIKLGKSHEAVARLRQCNRVSFLPGGLQLNRTS